MRFFVGLHRPKFLERTAVPACVSFGTLRRYKSLPAAVASYERMVSGHPGWAWRLVEVQAEHKGTK